MPNDRLRVLVPLDGSAESESILPALMPLFRSRPVRVTLLRVVPPDEAGAPAQDNLAALRRNLLLDGVQAESKCEWGRPAEEILYQSRGAWCDLVAMTTHGRTGLRRVVMGSTAEEVVRHAQVPVIANRPWTRVGDWSRIVVPLDGSARAESVIADAVRLAKLHRATVHVLGVSPPPVLTGGFEAVAIAPPQADPVYLEKICDRIASEGAMAVGAVREGPPGGEIAKYAAEFGAGLVCLATHGRTGLARVLMGSVAEEVLRNAPCPVYVRRTVEAPDAAGSARATA
jgi:nucleotide-binding universal stress UspA family protein